MCIWLLTREGAPPCGSLDEDGAAFWVSQVAPHGLDEPYKPADEREWTDDLPNEQALWGEWQGYAATRDRQLTSCRDIIEFMVELGLIEQGTGDEAWRTVSPLQHVEDVLPLNAERKAIESQVRWRQSFAAASDEIDAWIAQQRPPTATESEIETSLQAIASAVGLDLEDARHGLAICLDEDVRCDVDPETAASDEVIRLHIDWMLFGDWRTAYRAARSDGDAGAERPTGR